MTTQNTTTEKRLTKKEIEANEVSEIKARLLKILNGNRRIYTNLKRVSSSGMSRHISLHIANGNEITDITWYAGKILGYKHSSDTGGLVVGGCGMDMGFAVVYSLSRMLFPDGFKLVNGEYGRNGDKSGYDNDGGYCLKQQWL
jgi:hypothetical protein